MLRPNRPVPCIPNVNPMSTIAAACRTVIIDPTEWAEYDTRPVPRDRHDVFRGIGHGGRCAMSGIEVLKHDELSEVSRSLCTESSLKPLF